MKQSYNDQKLKTSIQEFKSALDFDEIESALEQLKKTEKVFNTELGDKHPFRTVIFYQYYMVYEEIGDFDKSEEFIVKAADWAELYVTQPEISDEVEKLYSTFFGDIEVIEHFGAGEKPGIIETIFDDCVQMYYADEKFIEAENYCLKAVNYFTKFFVSEKDMDKIYYMKFLLADIKTNLKRYNEAEDLLKKNIEIYETKEKMNYEILAKNYCRYAEVFIDQGKYEEAIECLKTVHQKVKQQTINDENKKMIYEALHMIVAGLGQVYFEKEMYQLAYDTWKEALIYVDELEKIKPTDEDHDEEDHEGHHLPGCLDEDCEGCCDEDCHYSNMGLESKFILYEDLASAAYELGLGEEAKNYRKLIEIPEAPTISCAQSKYLQTKDYSFEFNEDSPDNPTLNFSLMIKKLFVPTKDGIVDEISKLEEGNVLDFVLHLPSDVFNLSSITIENRKIFDFSFEFIFPPGVPYGTWTDMSINIYKNKEKGNPISVHHQSLYFHFESDDDILDLDELDEEQLKNIANLMMQNGGNQGYDEEYDDVAELVDDDENN
jgi:tetratricopeptide (TPR) repeat protein